MIVDDDGVIVSLVDKVPFLRSPYNYDKDDVSRETGLSCLDPSLAQQQFKEECDINTIVERFGITGQLPDNVKMPLSGDFVDVTDYQTAMNTVIAAQNAFMEMPADVRAEFDNDPGKFIAFAENPDNRERAKKLGLLVPDAPPPAPPMKVEVVNTPPPGKGDGPVST